jgi:hypothetical protein
VHRQSITDARFDECARTHCIDPARPHADDFDGFFRQRTLALLGLIERASGKSVSGRDAEEAVKPSGIRSCRESDSCSIVVGGQPDDGFEKRQSRETVMLIANISPPVRTPHFSKNNLCFYWLSLFLLSNENS